MDATGPPIFVTAYTPEYDELAARLLGTLARFRMASFAMPLRSTGDWRMNTFLKPRALCNAMMAFPTNPIVWVDADAEVVSSPGRFFQELAEADVDVACHHFVTKRGTEHLSGTLYLGPTERRARFLSAWVDMLEQHSHSYKGDQDAIADAAMVAGVDLYDLPRPYCQIFDAPRVEGQPDVIVHHQASRQMKRKVGR